MTTQPQNTDVVQGGQVEPPVTSAILGGVAGLQQRFLHLDTEQKLSVMPSLPQLGEPGIDFLIDALDDKEITIRAKAYQYLQEVDSERAKGAIANGIRLNVGDRLYSVYKSAISFDDEFFHLENESFDFVDEIDWEELGYSDYEAFCADENDDYGGGDITSYISKQIAWYISKAEAEAAAQQLHNKLVNEWDDEWGYSGCFEEQLNFALNEWCEANQVQFIGEYGYLYELKEELKVQGKNELLGKLWRDSVGDFAFVREEIITEPQYLKP